MSGKKESSHKRFSLFGSKTPTSNATSPGPKSINGHATTTRALPSTIHVASNSHHRDRKITVKLPEESDPHVSHKLTSSDLQQGLNLNIGYTIPALPPQSPERKSLELYNRDSKVSNFSPVNPSQAKVEKPQPSYQRHQAQKSVDSQRTLKPSDVQVVSSTPPPVSNTSAHKHVKTASDSSNNVKSMLIDENISPLKPSQMFAANIPLPETPSEPPLSLSTLPSQPSEQTSLPKATVLSNHSDVELPDRAPSVSSSTSSYYPQVNSSTEEFDFAKTGSATSSTSSYYPIALQQKASIHLASLSPQRNKPLSKPPVNTTLRRKPPPLLKEDLTKLETNEEMKLVTPTQEQLSPLSFMSSPSIKTTPPDVQLKQESVKSQAHHPSLKELPPVPSSEQDEDEDYELQKHDANNETTNNPAKAYFEEGEAKNNLLDTIDSEIQALRSPNKEDLNQSQASLGVEHPYLSNSSFSVTETSPLNFGAISEAEVNSTLESPSKIPTQSRINGNHKPQMHTSPLISNFQRVLRDDSQDFLTSIVAPPVIPHTLDPSVRSPSISGTEDEDYFEDAVDSFNDDVVMDSNDDESIENQAEKVVLMIPSTSTTNEEQEIITPVDPVTDSKFQEQTVDSTDEEINEILENIEDDTVDVEADEQFEDISEVRIPGEFRKRHSIVSRDSHELVSSDDDQEEQPYEHEYNENKSDSLNYENGSMPHQSSMNNSFSYDERYGSPNLNGAGGMFPQSPPKYFSNDEMEDDDDDDENDDKDLTFTASSPYYTHFDFNDDQPRKMMVVNPSANASVDDGFEEPRHDDEEDFNVNGDEMQQSKVQFEANSDDISASSSEELKKQPAVESSNGTQIPRNNSLELLYPSSKSHVKFPSSYDRREVPTVLPISHTDNKHTSKTLPRRPPPDFPSTGRNTRSVSDATAYFDLFDNVKTTGGPNDPNLLRASSPPVDNRNLHSPFADPIASLNKGTASSQALTLNGDDTIMPQSNTTEAELPLELKYKGVKSVYITNMRKRASTSYTDRQPSAKVLPIAIRPKSGNSHRRLYSHSRTSSKGGIFPISDAAIKHGGLKARTRMLASEMDDDELPDSKLSHNAAETMKPTDPDADVIEAAEQLKRLASPYLDRQSSIASTNSPPMDNSSLSRFASVRSARRFGTNSENKRFTLFIANPDGSDSD